MVDPDLVQPIDPRLGWAKHAALAVVFAVMVAVVALAVHPCPAIPVAGLLMLVLTALVARDRAIERREDQRRRDVLCRVPAGDGEWADARGLLDAVRVLRPLDPAVQGLTRRLAEQWLVSRGRTLDLERWRSANPLLADEARAAAIAHDRVTAAIRELHAEVVASDGGVEDAAGDALALARAIRETRLARSPGDFGSGKRISHRVVEFHNLRETGERLQVELPDPGSRPDADRVVQSVAQHGDRKHRLLRVRALARGMH